MALVTLLPQLRPSDQALVETQSRSGGGRKTVAWDTAYAEAAATIHPGGRGACPA